MITVLLHLDQAVSSGASVLARYSRWPRRVGPPPSSRACEVAEALRNDARPQQCMQERRAELSRDCLHAIAESPGGADRAGAHCAGATNMAWIEGHCGFENGCNGRPHRPRQ